MLARVELERPGGDDAACLLVVDSDSSPWSGDSRSHVQPSNSALAKLGVLLGVELKLRAERKQRELIDASRSAVPELVGRLVVDGAMRHDVA